MCWIFPVPLYFYSSLLSLPFNHQLPDCCEISTFDSGKWMARTETHLRLQIGVHDPPTNTVEPVRSLESWGRLEGGERANMSLKKLIEN